MVTLQPAGETSVRVSVAMVSLVTVAIVLRIIARLLTRSALAIEEALIILAACLFYSHQGLSLASILGPGAAGTSNPMPVGGTMTVPQLDLFFKYLYIGGIIFVITITVVKISILCFYRTIFAISRFRKLTWVVGVVCIIWLLVGLPIIIFQCSPIQAAWRFELHATGEAKCNSMPPAFFGLEIANVVVDIMILCLPIYMIRRLQMTAAKKRSVIAIFLVGGFVCVSCIIRAYYNYNPATGQAASPSGTFDWTTIQLASAIVCACLPTYAPLFKRHKYPTRLRSWYAPLTKNSKSAQQSKASSLRLSRFPEVPRSHDHPRYQHMSDDGVHLTRPLEQYRSWYSESAA
ncbi:hypothetical protein EPUS_01704 [Endocarpon pusillum Z07020]|uniref:Rhodopsin domain-containing protein n=1 Tax=Endocarpon pusillum (strain Z07020 / HMAS-L-300199) TaxID=1263415 RepID=U1HRM2_ENDPU|nr:uncharacterized protein EPUS_01704 [Endocarpon pusillum Z07020]ERF71789.1 hypothetical protein EPUS_01704 [Endocarpon pusillum Z07020]